MRTVRVVAMAACALPQEIAMFELDTFLAECEAARNEPQPASATKEALVRAIAQPAQLDAALGAAAQVGSGRSTGHRR